MPGVEEEEEEGAGGAREAQRRSRSTVSCSEVQGRASVERAKLWAVLLMSTLFTCRGRRRETTREEEEVRRQCCTAEW